MPPIVQPVTQAPPTQLPPEQAVPSAAFDHPVMLAIGWQTWQVLLGFGVPATVTVPPIKHPGTQLAPSQKPPGQVVPVATGVHAVLLEATWQLSQALAGFAAPGA